MGNKKCRYGYKNHSLPPPPNAFGHTQHTGMDFSPGEVPVCFEPARRSAGMAYRCIPSHFEPWIDVWPGGWMDLPLIKSNDML